MPDPIDARPSPTREFGRYALRRLLGRSVHTMTWLALDTREAQEVMLAMPRAAPPALAEWLDEARHAARLDHPRLAPVREVGAHEQLPYVGSTGRSA